MVQSEILIKLADIKENAKNLIEEIDCLLSKNENVSHNDIQKLYGYAASMESQQRNLEQVSDKI